MSISYDPDNPPQADLSLFERAMELRTHVVHVICDEPNSKHGDASGVSFFTLTDFLPRVGEQIDLEDGSSHTVAQVFYKTSRLDNFTKIIPNVYAVKKP